MGACPARRPAGQTFQPSDGGRIPCPGRMTIYHQLPMAEWRAGRSVSVRDTPVASRALRWWPVRLLGARFALRVREHTISMNTPSDRNDNSNRTIGATSGNFSGVGTASNGPSGGPIDQWRDDAGQGAANRLERLIDYSVVDRENNKVGTIDAVWSDQSGQPAYVGIKTGWLGMGDAHVVPADALEVSEGTRKIRLPYTVDEVKGAPSFDADHTLDEADEQKVWEYYGHHGLSGRRAAYDTTMDEERDITRDTTDTTLRGDTRTEDEVRVPLSREELKVGKREVEYGGVRLKKIIRTETVNKPVELQREEIVIERVPASERTPTRTDVAFREEEVYVPLRREEAVVEKTVHTDEEVRVGKRRETERRDVNETVRREDVDIQEQNTPGSKKK